VQRSLCADGKAVPAVAYSGGGFGVDPRQSDGLKLPEGLRSFASLRMTSFVNES